MALLEIRKFNDAALYKKAKKVRKIDDGIKALAKDMAETMRVNQGVGLAAPQVGVLKKIIIFEKDYRIGETMALINPRIIKKSKEKSVDTEGCLSFPEIYIDIKRAKKVKVKALNIEGEKIEMEAEGLLARILQHEIDHLNGIVFYKRLSLLKRIFFRGKNRF